MLRWYHVRLRANSYLGTQCCVVRRSVLKSYKFETRFGAGVDDFDLQIRLCRDGLKLVISRVVSVHIKNETFDEFVSHTQSTGKFRNHYFHKYGIGYLKYFPLTMEFYWILDSVLSGRIRLIPYHAVNGVVQTFGFFAGGP